MIKEGKFIVHSLCEFRCFFDVVQISTEEKVEVDNTSIDTDIDLFDS